MMLWTIEQRKEGIRITFDASVLFGKGSARLTRYAESLMRELADVVAGFSDANVVFESRAHSVDSARGNRTLSKQRASVLANLLSGIEVGASRLVLTQAKQETAPIDGPATTAVHEPKL